VTDTEITVVGAGVVGLAIAARLAPSHPDLMIVERRSKHGTETSSRNSQVIHAGIYYPPGSLKATLCREGRDRLYALCAGKLDLSGRQKTSLSTRTPLPEREAR